MTKTPFASIIIATYNSAPYLPELISSLRLQVLPEGEWLEILAIDGGSKDRTIEIAEELGCKVILNPDGNAIAAKSIGFEKASSRYICYLDHDEKLIDKNSIQNKIKIFQNTPNVVAVLTSGYLLSSQEPASNWYGSEFGDPFSRFRYRFPNSYPRRAVAFKARFNTVTTYQNGFSAVIGTETSPVLIELVATASFIDASYFGREFEKDLKQSNSIPHLYSLAASKKNISPVEIFMCVEDPILHNTADNWSYIFNKIRWRVNNAASPKMGVGPSGWSGRKLLEKQSTSLKGKYFFTEVGFVVYVLTVVPLLLDTLHLVISRKKLGYSMHFVLSWYVVFLGISRKINVLLKRPIRQLRYDGSE